MSLIPTPSEIEARLRKAFEDVVANEKKLGNNRSVVAHKISVAPDYVSNLLHERKGFGDITIAKIDEAYPGWRDDKSKEQYEKDAADENQEIKSNQKQSPYFGEISDDSFLKTILFCYEGLKDGHKEFLAMAANNLYKIDNPDVVDIAIPYKGGAQKEVNENNISDASRESVSAEEKLSRAKKMLTQSRSTMKTVRKNKNESGKSGTKDN